MTLARSLLGSIQRVSYERYKKRRMREHTAIRKRRDVSPRNLLILLFSLVLATAPHLLFGPAIVDDAYITFRYAENIAAGKGFVFNPQDGPVQGTSTPLFTLLLAAGRLAGLPCGAATLLLSVLGAALTYTFGTLLLKKALEKLVERQPHFEGSRPFLTGGLLHKGPYSAASPAVGIAAGISWAVLLATLPQWVIVQISGMETMLFVGLAVASLWAVTARRPFLAAGAAGLTVLARYDGWALAILVFAALAWDWIGGMRNDKRRMKPPLTPQSSALTPQSSALSPQSSALSTQHSAPSTQSSALIPQSSALSLQSSVLSPQHSSLSTQSSALGTHLCLAAALFLALQLLWVVYAFRTFGAYVPHSILTKRVIHSQTFWQGLQTHWNYFLGIEKNLPWLSGIWLHSRLVAFFLAGLCFLLIRRGWAVLLPLWGVASVIGFSMAGIVPFKWYFMPALTAYTWTAAWGLWAACGYLATQWGAVRPGQGTIVRGAVLWGLPCLVVLWVAAGGLELLLTGREEWPRKLSSQETSYLRGAGWVRERGAPGQRVVAGEVGALAWALPEFRVIDSSGINSRAAYQARLADHLRLEKEAAGSSVSIPPDGSAAWVWQILRDRPEWIVSLKRFLHLVEIESTPEFQKSYHLVHTIENPPAQAVLIYRLQSGSKP